MFLCALSKKTLIYCNKPVIFTHVDILHYTAPCGVEVANRAFYPVSSQDFNF